MLEAAPQPAAPTSSLENIAKLVDEGRTHLVGSVSPIDSAAIAYHGTKALAMLRRQPSESVLQLLTQLLTCLDSAIALAWCEHRFTNEVNAPATASTSRSRRR